MAIVNGVVSAVSTKYDKYSVQVDGVWYGTKAEWAKVKPVAGDAVEFDNGGGKYTKNMRIVSGSDGSGGGAAPTAAPKAAGGFKPAAGRTFPVQPDAPERTINRQNALTNATNFVIANLEKSKKGEDLVATIISVAERLEAYTTGDLDMARAKEALEGTVGE